MTAPTRSFPTQFGRFYSHPSAGLTSAIGMMSMDPEGEGPYAPKPSITNIIGVLDEGFLPGYYAKLVAEHAVQNLEGLNYQVSKFGPEIAVGALKAIPSRPNPASAIGDEVHDAIDRFCHGGVTTEFATITAKQMFAQFTEFILAEKPRIATSEFTVWSYKHGYAGTGDLMWHWRDQLWIVDTKTGNRCYPKVAMQCAALANADVILADDGTERPMPKVGKIGVFHVRPRSARLYELQHGDEAFQAFLGLKAAFDWQRFYKPQTIPMKPLAEVEHRVG